MQKVTRSFGEGNGFGVRGTGAGKREDKRIKRETEREGKRGRSGGGEGGEERQEQRIWREQAS
jgi:hypothetical protein